MLPPIDIPVVEVKRLRPDVAIPAQQTPGAAGYDLCAALDRPQLIYPYQTVIIPTGIAFHIYHPHIVGLVSLRSGFSSRKQAILINSVGVIDSDYTGEVKLAVCNLNEDPIQICHNDRIAQIVFATIPTIHMQSVDTFTFSSERGEGGFGSTG